jgi:DNA-binding NarL/FixJ family response regulator
VCDDCRVGLTVLIVDDHPAFRSSARRLFEDEGFDVVGEAEDGETALALARRLEPELVLLDVGLPGLSGYEVAERLAGGRSKVVLVSSRAQEDLGRRLDATGAAGFISKDRLTPEAVLALVRAA